MEEPGLVAKILWLIATKRFAKIQRIQVKVDSEVDVFGTDFGKFCKVSNF